MTQLALPTMEEAPSWWRTVPDRTGLAAHTVLIRAEDDPDETIERGAGADSAAWKDVRKVSADEWLTRIAMTLADGVPRTFNRLAVELTGRTADVFLGEPIEDALWLGVESGVLEYCPVAPIRFRLRADAPEVRP